MYGSLYEHEVAEIHEFLQDAVRREGDGANPEGA